jgi:hypothetical protein
MNKKRFWLSSLVGCGFATFLTVLVVGIFFAVLVAINKQSGAKSVQSLLGIKLTHATLSPTEDAVDANAQVDDIDDVLADRRSVLPVIGVMDLINHGSRYQRQRVCVVWNSCRPDAQGEMEFLGVSCKLTVKDANVLRKHNRLKPDNTNCSYLEGLFVGHTLVDCKLLCVEESSADWLYHLNDKWQERERQGNNKPATGHD